MYRITDSHYRQILKGDVYLIFKYMGIKLMVKIKETRANTTYSPIKPSMIYIYNDIYKYIIH